MNDLRTAAQQALEQPEQDPMCVACEGKPTPQNSPCGVCGKLAQQDQEPVAWMVYTLDGKSVCVTDSPQDFTDGHRALPLYTHPPRREPEPPPEPLHEDKIRAEFRDIERHTLLGDMTLEDWFEAGVRYAERQHEIV